MVAFSSLRMPAGSNEKVARFMKAYGRHRPVIQRILNISFIFYVLGATYTGLSGKKSGAGKDRSKRKGNDTQAGKEERVAVRPVALQIEL